MGDRKNNTAAEALILADCGKNDALSDVNCTGKVWNSGSGEPAADLRPGCGLSGSLQCGSRVWVGAALDMDAAPDTPGLSDGTPAASGESGATSTAGTTGASAPLRAGLPLYLEPVAAGFPSPADDYVEEQLDLHRHLVRNPAATFFLRAQGDSMVNAGVYDGDLLVVDRSVEAGPNRVVIAALDGELTVKRLVRRKGRVSLMPENPDYPAIDITEREGVHIWGVVTYVVHKL